MNTNTLCFEPQLEKLYKTRKLRGRSGNEVSATGLSTPHNLIVIRRIILDKKPLRTLEVGMAYGGSSLAILSTLREVHGIDIDYRHISIDPFQSCYDYCGVEILKRCGHDGRFECLETRSDVAFPKLVAREERIDFIYVDGSHIFENVFIDFFYSAQILNQNGIILFDDCAHHHVDKVIRFIRSNLSECFIPYPLEKFQDQKSFIKKLANKLGYAQIKGFKKIGKFPREFKNFKKF
jgi:predicted O-methyltransferase YrrM